jgi:DNA-binding transcriptional MerR regulator
VNAPGKFLNPSDAAKQLGVSVKALRLYEERGLVTPMRTAAGWRAFGPHEMERAAEVVALRALGFSLTQVQRVLAGDSHGLEQALAAHQTALETQRQQIAQTVENVRKLRDELAHGRAPTIGELAHLQAPAQLFAAFDLPWPWGGERFELRTVKPLNYIVGPLFSGKTKLAKRIAETLPNAAFIGLDRTHAELDAGDALRARVDQALAWLIDDGATRTDALIALLAALESDGLDALVVDMIEQGLDEPTQHALIAHLRRRGANARPVFATTRSCAILDLASVGANEAIILCPANHSPPAHVTPHPGAPGYEAVATCLASPDVRARTQGVIAVRGAELARR